jgi:hypothetical protein
MIEQTVSRAKKVRVACLLTAALAAALPASAETKLTMSVTPGPNWETTAWFGVFPVKKNPQIAVWIADSRGVPVTGLTVTASAANGKWKGNPKGGRPDALPVWSYAMAALKAAGGALDASSSATPRAGLELERRTGVLTDGSEYTVYLEVNTSFDYNSVWTKKAKQGEEGWSGVNGQPSVVYAARFIAGSRTTVRLVPVGTGAVDGGDGNIRPGTAGLTSALSIIESAELTVGKENSL